MRSLTNAPPPPPKKKRRKEKRKRHESKGWEVGVLGKWRGRGGGEEEGEINSVNLVDSGER